MMLLNPATTSPARPGRVRCTALRLHSLTYMYMYMYTPHPREPNPAAQQARQRVAPNPFPEGAKDSTCVRSRYLAPFLICVHRTHAARACRSGFVRLVGCCGCVLHGCAPGWMGGGLSYVPTYFRGLLHRYNVHGELLVLVRCSSHS